MKASFKNYTLPQLSQSNQTKTPRKAHPRPEQPFYSSHLLPHSTEVPSLCLGTKALLAEKDLEGPVYCLPSKLSLLSYNVWF